MKDFNREIRTIKFTKSAFLVISHQGNHEKNFGQNLVRQ